MQLLILPFVQSARIAAFAFLTLVLVIAFAGIDARASTRHRHLSSSTQGKSHYGHKVTTHEANSRHNHRLKGEGAHHASGKGSKSKAEPEEKNQVSESYEQATRDLAKVYALCDQAANEKMSGDYGLALKHYLEAKQILQASNGSAGYANESLDMDLASCAELAGQPLLALKLYNEGVKHNLRLADVHCKLASLLAEEGKLAEASAEAKKAVEANRADPRAHLLLGLLFECQGNMQEARIEQARAWELLSAYPTTAKGLGLSKEIQKNEIYEPEEGGESNAEMPLGLP